VDTRCEWATAVAHQSARDEEWRARILNPPVSASPSARLRHRHRRAVPWDDDLTAVRVSRQHHVDSQSRVKSPDSVGFVRQYHSRRLVYQTAADQRIRASFFQVVQSGDAQRATGPDHTCRRVDKHISARCAEPLSYHLGIA
jgi:hypothetical protein